jgi:hypothetical protein
MPRSHTESVAQKAGVVWRVTLHPLRVGRLERWSQESYAARAAAGFLLLVRARSST